MLVGCFSHTFHRARYDKASPTYLPQKLLCYKYKGRLSFYLQTSLALFLPPNGQIWLSYFDFYDSNSKNRWNRRKFGNSKNATNVCQIVRVKMNHTFAGLGTSIPFPPFSPPFPLPFQWLWAQQYGSNRRWPVQEGVAVNPLRGSARFCSPCLRVRAKRAKIATYKRGTEKSINQINQPIDQSTNQPKNNKKNNQ